jgi:hypothetical protein
MRTRTCALLALVLAVFAADSTGRVAVGQQRPARVADSALAADESRQIFSDIEIGLSQGNPSVFSDHLASQLYLSIPGEQSAYFSSSQAFYLLEQFFQRTRLPDFRFTTMADGPGTPYASGIVSGVRGQAQVYVSLSRSGERWVISKISIY